MIKHQSYREIELETFCLVSSCGSKQPVKPTTIIANAKTAKAFFIILSSKRVVLFLSLRAFNKARDNLYHDCFIDAILKIMVFFTVYLNSQVNQRKSRR